jgi:hypothetical protein
MPRPSQEDAAVRIPARFCGPRGSGNGGYTAGLLAERALNHPDRASDCAVVEVTLRRPPPLEVDLAVVHDTDAGVTRLLHEDALVAEARCSADDIAAVEEVTPGQAVDASERYPGFGHHPFPHCFSCGPQRQEGDGLRIFPGRVADHDGRVAAPWTPHASLAEASDLLDEGVERVGLATTWAALDCVGGWASDLIGRPMVLGRISAWVDAHPVVGEPHVVVGVELGSEGRKTFTASTLYDSDGRIVGRARHVWVAVDPKEFER